MLLCVSNPPPPKGRRSPPKTVHHSRAAYFSITQLKVFFGAFGACDPVPIDFLLFMGQVTVPPFGGGGRKRVNKALHTCTSWYAYAAMFGSSIDTMVPQALERMYRLH